MKLNFVFSELVIDIGDEEKIFINKVRKELGLNIKVIDGGWQMDAGQQPTECSDLYSIAQDVKHLIMESGLLRELQGERHVALRSDVLVQIEQLTETDIRIIPGSATATEIKHGEITLTAETYEFGTTDEIQLSTEQVNV